MTRTFRQLRSADRALPAKVGHLCLGLVAFAACASEPDEPRCEARVLRIASVAVPHNNQSARDLGLDLNGDQTIDNQLGMVTATVQFQLGMDPHAAINTRLASDLEWRIGVATCDDGTARLDPGTAMPIGAMFDPTGTFDIGWIESTRLRAIEVAPLADGTTWTGRIGMGLAPAAVADAIVPPVVAYMNAHGLFIDDFDDAPKDGQISVEEMRDSTLVMALLAPDLGDRGQHGLSFGIAFTATELPSN